MTGPTYRTRSGLEWKIAHAQRLVDDLGYILDDIEAETRRLTMRTVELEPESTER